MNCGGPHPANYSKCPEYIKHLDKIQARRNKNKQPAGRTTHDLAASGKWQQPPLKTLQDFPTLRTREIPPSQPNQPTEALWKKKQTPKYSSENVQTNNNIEDYQSLISEIAKLSQLCNVSKIFRIVRELNSRLVNCRDDLARLQVSTHVAKGKY